MNDFKLVGLKSHDYHVLMQQLLAVAIQDILPNKVRLVVAIQDILPNKVRLAITRLCFFFNAICSKVVGPLKLDDLENKVVIILC